MKKASLIGTLLFFQQQVSALTPNGECIAGQCSSGIANEHNNDAFSTPPLIKRKRSIPQKTENSDGHNDRCRLFLAESSIPNAGLGLYTAVDVRKGQEVGDPDLLVAVPDFPFDWWMVSDVQWSSSLYDDVAFESLTEPSLFYPGFGAAVNCHHGHVNVEHTRPTTDSAGLHRRKDPGVGAFSNYYNIGNRASADIEAGSELFVDYGESWFTDRAEWLGIIPFEEDFEVADRILQKATNLSTGMNDDMWDFVRSIADERVRAALPSERKDLDHALHVGTARYSLPNVIRTPQWLQENGLCIDNIYTEESSIPQSGRGAFAKRSIRAGSIVAPAPVLQLNRTYMTLYERLPIVDGEARYSDEVIGHQLLLNYCLGHKNSSVLLLPYGPLANFINHNGTSPNVGIRWSSLNKQDMMSLPPEELLEYGFGLMMEFVALRDILPDEELVMDYGKEWEAAWAEHVETWTAPEGADDYVPASEIDIQSAGIRTEDEQEDNPYPSNLQTACYYKPPPKPEDEQEYEEEEEDEFIVETIQVRWQNPEAECLRPCVITEKGVVEGYLHFTAEMMNTAKLEEECLIPENESHVVFAIPPHALKLIDRVYTRDQSLRNAFRHEIGLPDDALPAGWMDLGKE